MALHLIELSDCNIRVSDADSVLGNSPGFANIAQGSPVFGDDALQQARLHPRQSFNQFWAQLSLDPLVNSNQLFRHQADLAYAHLNNLAVIHSIKDDVIFAVPSNYNRNQLSILLGLVKQCPFNAVGLVDMAVLNSARVLPGIQGQALFVDVQLHQTVLTLLEIKDGRLARSKIQQIPGTGLLALYDAWANMVTDEFINQSRFDPQHNADTEQYVYNQLKHWLTDTMQGNEVLLEINNKGSVHQAKVNLGYFEQRSRSIVNRIKDEIQSLTSPGVTIYLPASMALLPGLTRYLSNVIVLDDAELSNNAFANLEHIIRESGALGLVTSLPVAGEQVPEESKPSAAPPKNAANTKPSPTHLLLNHQAYALPTASVYFGLDNNREINIINSPEDALLTISLQPGQAFQVSGEFLLNGSPFKGESSLQLGDIISFDTSSTTIQLIQVM